MQLVRIDKRELLERVPGIVFESSVVDLGVVIDQELQMDVHVGIMTRSCFYQLYANFGQYASPLVMMQLEC